MTCNTRRQGSVIPLISINLVLFFFSPKPTLNQTPRCQVSQTRHLQYAETLFFGSLHYNLYVFCAWFMTTEWLVWLQGSASTTVLGCSRALVSSMPRPARGKHTEAVLWLGWDLQSLWVSLQTKRCRWRRLAVNHRHKPGVRLRLSLPLRQKIIIISAVLWLLMLSGDSFCPVSFSCFGVLYFPRRLTGQCSISAQYHFSVWQMCVWIEQNMPRLFLVCVISPSPNNPRIIPILIK